MRQRIYARHEQGVGIGRVELAGVPAPAVAQSESGREILNAAIKTGMVLNDVLAKEYRRNEEGRVSDSLLAAEREFEEWKADYRQKNQGRLAVNALRDFNDKHEKIAKRTLEGFGGEGEIFREDLKRKLALRGLYALKDGESWQMAQTAAWQKSVYDGRMASFERMIADYPDDPQRLDMAVSELVGDWQRLNPGLDPSAVRMKLEEIRDTGRIEAMFARGDTEGVRRMLSGEARANIRGMPSEVEGLARKYARKYGVPEELGLAVIMQESSGRQSSVSRAGARGVMQLMPGTAAELGVDPDDLEQNIDGGMRYLKKQLDDFGGNERHALMAYNGGPGAVRQWQKGKKQLAGETMEYPDRVLGRMSGLSAKNRAMYAKRLKVEEERSRAVARYRLQERLKDSYAAWENGELVLPPGDDELKYVYGDDWPKEKRKIDEARQFSEDLRGIRGMSEEAAMKMLAERQPEPGEGYAEKMRLWQRLGQAVHNEMDMRQKDGVGYLRQFDPRTAAAWRAFGDKPGPENARAYVEALRTGAAVRGMRLEGLLGLDEGKRMGQLIMDAANPLELLKEMQGIWGGYWEDVMRELGGKLSPAVNFAVSIGDDRAARLVLEAVRDRDFVENATKFIKDSTPLADVEAGVRETLRDLSASIRAGGDDGTAFAIEENTRNLALKYMVNDGLDKAGAVKRASAVIMDQYNFIHAGRGLTRFRAPVRYAEADIEEGARECRKRLANDLSLLNTAAIPGMDKDMDKAVIAGMIRNSGQWVTNPDESGVELYLYNAPVFDKNGHIIGLTWEQLVEAAAKARLEHAERLDKAAAMAVDSGALDAALDGLGE